MFIVNWGKKRFIHSPGRALNLSSSTNRSIRSSNTFASTNSTRWLLRAAFMREYSGLLETRIPRRTVRLATFASAGDVKQDWRRGVDGDFLLLMMVLLADILLFLLSLLMILFWIELLLVSFVDCVVMVHHHPSGILPGSTWLKMLCMYVYCNAMNELHLTSPLWWQWYTVEKLNGRLCKATIIISLLIVVIPKLICNKHSNPGSLPSLHPPDPPPPPSAQKTRSAVGDGTLHRTSREYPTSKYNP